jgi:two-component system, LytTR family, response regulator
LKIRTLIVDDEPLARLRVRELLAKEADVEIEGEAKDGPTAVTLVRELTPDLVFLDIQMPELDGFGVLEQLGARRIPALVFVTAYDRFALRAFEAHALDYLLKPYDDQRFAAALERAREHLRYRSADDLERRVRELLADVRGGPRRVQRLAVQSGARTILLPVGDIDWFEAEGKYVRLQVGARSYLLRDTMRKLEAALDPGRFLRIHRSIIVNVERIREVEAYFRGEYILFLRDGTQLRSGRSYRRAVQRLLGRDEHEEVDE